MVAAISTETAARPRILLLDMLRGVAALIVATAHAATYLGITLPAHTAEACVWFFFALSGYVLSHAYGAEIAAGAVSARAFVGYRLARLYPLHAVTTVFMVVAWFLLLGHHRNSFVTDAEAFTFTHFIFGGGKSPNPPSWSISVEFWGSLLVFMLLTGRRAAQAAIVAAVAAFVAFGSGELQATYAVGFAFMVGGWALYQLDGGRSFTAQPLPRGLMARAGDWSYGIYLWHHPVMFLLVGALRLVEKTTGVQLLGTAAFAVVYFPALLVTARYSFRYFEVPARRKLRDAFSRYSRWHPVRARAAPLPMPPAPDWRPELPHPRSARKTQSLS